MGRPALVPDPGRRRLPRQSRAGRAPRRGELRPLREPGSYWEYNDVRINQLSLALLDQSSRTLQALTSQAMPPKAETYGRRGGMRVQHHPEAALISGRL